MTFVHRETKRDARGASTQKNLQPSAHSSEDLSPTLEIAIEPTESPADIVVAVTADEEVRAALVEALPMDSILFADTAEQVLARPVPNHCAVLIVEPSLGRAAFEKVKAHLKVSAPALVNIMVGNESDGSTLVGMLSTGSIDRFMIKPLKPGPARSALRSALQQHHSLLPRAPVQHAAHAVDAGSKTGGVPELQVTVIGSSLEQVKHQEPIARTEKRATAKHPVAKAKADVGKRENGSNDNGSGHASTGQASTVQAVAAASKLAVHSRSPAAHQSPDRSLVQREVERYGLSPHAASEAGWHWKPQWNLVAGIVALVGLLALGILTRTPGQSVRDEANKIDASKVVASQLAAAQRAFEVGSYVEPQGLNAAYFFNAVLELDPNNVRAQEGLRAVADRLIADTKQLIAAGDLLRAQSTLDHVRRLQPNHVELAAVTASLLKTREAERSALQAARSSKPSVAPQVAAAPVVGRSSSVVERKVSNPPQRLERVTQIKPAATAAPPAVSTKSAVATVAGVTGMAASIGSSTQIARDTPVSAMSVKQEPPTPVRAEEAKTAEPIVEAAPRAAAKPESVTEPIAAGVAVASAAVLAPGPVTAVSTSAAAPSSANAKSTLIKYVPPVYPFKARSDGAEGWLDVHFFITPEGTVVNPRIGNGTVGEKFHRAALTAVTQWRFAPVPGAVQPRPMHARLEFKLTK